MASDLISGLLNDLTRLLSKDISPHTISLQFQNIASLLGNENLNIEILECKEYYQDRDLSLILLMKNEAMANGQYEQATKFHFIEMELLAEKGDTPFTRLTIEPDFFEYKYDHIIFHFNKRKENQRLIANLIEGYNFLQQKGHIGKGRSGTIMQKDVQAVVN